MEFGVLIVVSLLLNIVLLYALLMFGGGRRYMSVMAEDDPVTRPGFKRYILRRDVDVSGVSGTGVVCEVVEFSDGEAAVHFLSDSPTTTPHPRGLKSVVRIHGHGGRTRLVPVDPG